MSDNQSNRPPLLGGSSSKVVVAEGFATTNRLRLWYEHAGQPGSAPVLLVMGVDSSAIWWPPELVAALVDAGYRVIRFDNRDVGLSTYLDDSIPPYGLADMAHDAVGLLDALGLDSAHFVGMSLGGMISQQVALSSPECSFADTDQHHPGSRRTPVAAHGRAARLLRRASPRQRSGVHDRLLARAGG